MYVEMNKKIYEGTPYGYDSGGNPIDIAQLSYDEVLEMHRYYYNPSNTSFFFYGNADINPQL